MPPRPYRPPELAWQMFLGSQALEDGLLTRHQLRGRAWQRIRHDVYADARFDRDHALACRAAVLRLPETAVLAGASAAYLHGVDHAARFADDVEVVVPWKARVPRLHALRVHTLDLDPTEVAHRNGLPLTTPARTCWDLAGWADLPAAVASIDSLLHLGLVGTGELRAYLESRVARRGYRLASRAFALADPGAQSPQESRTRVLLVLAGLPRPVCQHEVRLPDGTTFHPDLAWPEYQVALEYDGVWHADPEQFHRDRRRLNLLTGSGWIVLHVTGQRLRGDAAGILREVRAALYSRGCPLSQLH